MKCASGAEMPSPKLMLYRNHVMTEPSAPPIMANTGMQSSGFQRLRKYPCWAKSEEHSAMSTFSVA